MCTVCSISSCRPDRTCRNILKLNDSASSWHRPSPLTSHRHISHRRHDVRSPQPRQGIAATAPGPPEGGPGECQNSARTPKRRHRATWLQAKYECDSASMSSDTLRQQVKRGGVAVRLPRLRTHRCAAVSRQGTTTGRLTFLCVPLRELPTTVRCPVSNCGTQIMSPMCYQLHHNAIRDSPKSCHKQSFGPD